MWGSGLCTGQSWSCTYLYSGAQWHPVARHLLAYPRWCDLQSQFCLDPEKNSSLTSQLPQGTTPACPTGSQWSGSFLTSESSLGSHTVPCPDCIITSSPPSRGEKYLLFAFLLSRHPQPLAGFPKPPPDGCVGHTGFQACRVSLSLWGVENHHPATMPFSPVSLVPPPLWILLGPFSCTRIPPPPHTPVGRHMHMDKNRDAFCPGTAGD